MEDLRKQKENIENTKKDIESKLNALVEACKKNGLKDKNVEQL